MPSTYQSLICVSLAIAIGGGSHAADRGDPMQYGPVLCHSVTFVKPPNNNAPTWEGAVTRAVNIALPNDHTACYDADQLSLASFWQGAFLDTSRTHLTSYKGNICPRPGASPIYLALGRPGWASPSGALEASAMRFDGYHLHGDRVLLNYTVAGRAVAELPGAGEGFLTREFDVAAGEDVVSLLVASFAGKAKINRSQATITADGRCFICVLSSDGGALSFRLGGGDLYVDVPASRSNLRFKITQAVCDADELAAQVESMAGPFKPADFAALTKGGRRRWKETFITAGVLGDQPRAYALDDLPVPERPYGAWMRLSAIDFFEDGRAAVATMSGDVWIASWPAGSIEKVTWQRYATGLYEPLGLKVVDGTVYVRGRDRITRLYDLNGDGEADRYENFHSHGPIGPGYHAFIFDLRRAPQLGDHRGQP